MLINKDNNLINLYSLGILKMLNIIYFNLFHGMIYSKINIVGSLCGIFLTCITLMLSMLRIWIKVIRAKWKSIKIKSGSKLVIKGKS